MFVRLTSVTALFVAMKEEENRSPDELEAAIVITMINANYIFSTSLCSSGSLGWCFKCAV